MSEPPAGDPSTAPTSTGPDPLLLEKFSYAVERLEEARSFAKGRAQNAVLDIARRLLTPGGLPGLFEQAARLDSAGLFTGTDWDRPDTLLPSLVRSTFEQGHRTTVVLECLSELRFLAIATGTHATERVSREQARHFLTQVLAHNLSRLFAGGSETARRADGLDAGIDALLRYLLEHIGFGDILGELVSEIERILDQRPIQVGSLRAMVTQIAVSMSAHGHEMGAARPGAERLTTALFGPTPATAPDPGIVAYEQVLAGHGEEELKQEAYAFARAMHEVGLVSDYHATFLRWAALTGRTALLAPALGLSSTGIDVLSSYLQLVVRLIDEAIHPQAPQTAQAVYGLSLMLERGILYIPSIGPALWRHLGLTLSAEVRGRLAAAFGEALPPRTFLLAGILSLLGQPLGIGQGNNPTCQSARALSMWSYSDPDFLLHIIAQAAHFDTVMLHFEGQPIDSASLAMVSAPPLDTDAVSVLMVPHLDRIYHEMGRRCADRGEDPHRWINPELHGWFVGRKFMIAVDVATGLLRDFTDFIRQFYTSYHPYYNGNQPLIHPQPAGVAITDSSGHFVGWHAITILRVTIDQDDAMRVYFFNPNNDSGQDWGHGVKVSTQGHGERHGESSLPFAEMASRLYIYHDDPILGAVDAAVPEADVETVRAMAEASWAEGRVVDR